MIGQHPFGILDRKLQSLVLGLLLFPAIDVWRFYTEGRHDRIAKKPMEGLIVSDSNGPKCIPVISFGQGGEACPSNLTAQVPVLHGHL